MKERGRGTFKEYHFRPNSIQKGKELDVGAEPSRIELCKAPPE